MRFDASSLRANIERSLTFSALVIDEPVELDHEWRLGLLSWFKDQPVYRFGYAYDVSDTTELRTLRFATDNDLVGYAFLLLQFEGADELVVGWTRTKPAADAAVVFVNRSFARLRALRDARRDGTPVPLLSSAAQELQLRIESGERDREGDPLAGFVPSALPLFERDEVGVVLAGQVEKWQDWAPGWLVETGSLRGYAALRAVVDRPTGPAGMKIRAAWALAKLHHDSDGFAALVSTPLLRSQWWEDRNLVANLLARVPQAEADEALLELVGDDHDLVRYSAFDALCTRWCLPSAGDCPQSLLRILHIRHQFKFAAIREPAVQAIRTLFLRRRQGDTSESLGLLARGGNAATTRVEKSMILPHGAGDEWPFAWDLQALRTLTSGIDREWAVAAAISLLERGDPRAPEGLVALGATEALPTLRAMRDQCEPALAQHVERAIAGLTR